MGGCWVRWPSPPKKKIEAGFRLLLQRAGRVVGRVARVVVRVVRVMVVRAMVVAMVTEVAVTVMLAVLGTGKEVLLLVVMREGGDADTAAGAATSSRAPSASPAPRTAGLQLPPPGRPRHCTAQGPPLCPGGGPSSPPMCLGAPQHPTVPRLAPPSQSCP